MKIYKVYARGCFAAHPVKEISKSEAFECISEEIFNSDKEYEYTMMKAEKFFYDKRFFDCGDFRLIFSEEEPPRCNCYGNSINEI